MTVNASRYANWKAPSQDGSVLIWPPPAELVPQTRDNAKTLAAASEVKVQGISVADLRRSIRNWLGHRDDSVPLIATGHQTELYHPGVWVKDAAINAIADSMDGVAWHFAVDTDQPKHLSIRWPGTTLAITDDPMLQTADWSGLLAGPTPAYLQTLLQTFRAAREQWNFEPMLGVVLESIRKSSLNSQTGLAGLSAAITNAQHELDWSLGLKHHAMLVSPLLFSPTYLTFVHHILSRADEFAADYNASLADYRTETGISSQTRPMPDLHVTPEVVEVPFWLDDLANGTRKRAEVCRMGENWSLTTDTGDFELLADASGEKAADRFEAWLKQHSLRLSPRALTLTTFLRLLVVDQFIHGIGGGRYDQVTDRLLARHFKIDPPRFAVATGTLFFPGAVGRTRVCMPCVASEGHRLKHNLLGPRKQHILDQINALPRRSVQRSLAFHNLHGALSAAATDHPALKEWAARFELTIQQDREEQVLFDRELFYGIQTHERLTKIITETRTQFA